MKKHLPLIILLLGVVYLASTLRPEKNPTAGNQNHTSDSQPRARANVVNMATKKPKYEIAIARR